MAIWQKLGPVFVQRNADLLNRCFSGKGCVGPTWKPVDYSILAMGPSRKRSEEQKKKKSDKKKADLLARKEIRKRIERVNDQLIKNVRLLEEADL